MAKYRFKGYTITNCGYHQPDHCVWWEAVDGNGEACFHGHSLREVEFMILDHEWEQKMKDKDAVIEQLKSQNRRLEKRERGNAAAVREALKNLVDVIDSCASSSPLWWHNGAKGVIPLKNAKAALSAPPRNCDIHADFTDAITTLANKRNWHDGKWDSERYCILANWLLAPAAERKGGAE